MIKKYEEIYTNIDRVKKQNDLVAADYLFENYSGLVHKILLKLKRTFRFVDYMELLETTKAFFTELVVQYDVKINDNFTNYIGHKLYFRVKEFMSFDYEHTEMLHKNIEDRSVEYCNDLLYKSEHHDYFNYPNITDVVDFLESYLTAEEMDMFVCYYVLCYTQEQMSSIFGMTQCPINLKMANIAGVVKRYFEECRR